MRAWLVAAVLASVSSQGWAEDCGDDTLQERVIRHEGYRACVYEDIYGNPTIGVGHLLKRPVPDDLCWDRHKVYATLAHDLERAERGAARDYGKGFHSLPEHVREVLSEMAFWIGPAGLSRFHGMMTDIRRENYAGAAVELLDSRLAKQVPGRAQELACLLRQS